MHKHTGSTSHRSPDSVAHSKACGVLLGVLSIAQLMVILDITAVNIALPSLATDLELVARPSAGRSRATP